MSDSHAIYIRFDDGYWAFARACLNSVCRNYPGHPSLIVDYRGSNTEVLLTLGEIEAEVLPAGNPPEFSRFLHRDRGGEAVVDRLKLWQRPFDRFDTILHLDADMLVLAPLDDLFEHPTPYFVANHETTSGVRIFGEELGRSSELDRLLEEDGIAMPSEPDDMVNAGLFTIPRRFRSRENLALLAQLSERYGQYFAFADQSLLSLWLRATGLRPNHNFGDNFQTPFFTDPTAARHMNDIRVLHFSSHRKPGTYAFENWERVGADRERIAKMFEYYRDAPVPTNANPRKK